MAWNDGLSPEQATAASLPDRFVRLLSGPGTGKTRTITRRGLFLREELDVLPDDILVLTFGRAAARELRERFEEAGGTSPTTSTIHSFALRQLMRNGAAPELPSPILIADDIDEREVIYQDLKHILDRGLREVAESFQDLASDYETLDAETDDWERDYPDPRFLNAFREHRTIFGYTLRSELVYRVKRALEERPEFQIERTFKHLIVDEYQDLNRCELAVIRALVTSETNLFVAGDDDQSIYSFRHAFPQGIREFSDQYPGASESELEVCHRCARDILRVARAVAEGDHRAEPKNLRPRDDAPEGDVHVLSFSSGASEARGIARVCRSLIEEHGVPPHEILVLHRMDRSGGFSQPIIDELERIDIRAARVTNPFAILEEGEGRLVAVILRLLVRPDDALAWRQLLELRENRVGAITLRSVYEFALEQGLLFTEALDRIRQDPGVIEARGRRHLQEDLASIDRLLAELEPLKDEPMPEALTRLLQVVLDREDVSEYFEVLFLLAGEDPESLKQVSEGMRAVRDYVDEVLREGEQDAVRFMSMHSAKGLTATAVIIPNVEDELLPGRATTEAEIGDERRLLYVSLTRATRHLYVTYAASRGGLQAHAGRASGHHRLTRFLEGLVQVEAGDRFLPA